MTHTVETLGLDRETLFPRWAKAVMRGEPLCCHAGAIEAAQDRVAMRRYIRRRVPALSRALRDMGESELSELVDNLKEMESHDEPL